MHKTIMLAQLLALVGGWLRPTHWVRCMPRAYPVVAVTVIHKSCASLPSVLANVHVALGTPIFLRHNPGALAGTADAALFQRLRARCHLFTEELKTPIMDIESYSAYLASAKARRQAAAAAAADAAGRRAAGVI